MSNPVAFRRRAGFLLATLGRRTESAWTAFLRDRGLTNAEFGALAVLASESPGQAELAAYLGIDARNAGSLVRKLVSKGWVQVAVHDEDRRRRVISLTAQGAQTWTALQGELPGARGGFFAGLDVPEQRELERLLNKLNDAHLDAAHAGVTSH